jgi:hypothetical protein
MYKTAQLTEAQIAKLHPDLRREIESLQTDSDNFDTELYEVFAENDRDLFELAQGQSTSVSHAVEPTAVRRGPKPKEKRPKKQADAYSETVTIDGNSFHVGADTEGNAQYGLDKNGQLLRIGDTVKAEIKGHTYIGVIASLKARKGGGHLVRYTDAAGNKKTAMLQPSAIAKKSAAASGEDTPVAVYKMRLPKSLVKKAEVARRTDCDENEAILVTPTEKVEIEAPTVADPAKGDKILAHPDGTPMTVIEGKAVDQHFEVEGKAGIETRKDGTVTFDVAGDETPETAAQPQPADDETKYSAVKAKKPTSKCEFSREKAKSPALMTFLEGMRLHWHDGESKDKIIGVYYLKNDNKVLLKVKAYDWMDLFADIRYYTVCPESGRLTRTEKPGNGAASVLLSQAAMKEFYRHPFGQSCKRVSKALYVECYRNGACSTEKQKRLYQIFASKCIRQEKAHSREYLKWAHQQTAKQWEGYEGPKTYAQVFKETLAMIRSGKR